MMRYSFEDFLNYQNELNKRCDEKKVQETIDIILEKLKHSIERHPTRHKTCLTIFFKYMTDDSSDHLDFSLYTATELSKIKQYFEEMGFKVSYCYDDTYVPNPSDYIRGFTFKW